jgi:Uma2 family endonuclease
MALTGRLTLEEFLLLPEAEPAYEYVKGTVTQKVSPKARHGKLQGTLYLLFETHGSPRRLLSAFTETRVVWPEE